MKWAVFEAKCTAGPGGLYGKMEGSGGFLFKVCSDFVRLPTVLEMFRNFRGGGKLAPKRAVFGARSWPRGRHRGSQRASLRSPGHFLWIVDSPPSIFCPGMAQKKLSQNRPNVRHLNKTMQQKNRAKSGARCVSGQSSTQGAMEGLQGSFILPDTFGNNVHFLEAF